MADEIMKIVAEQQKSKPLCEKVEEALINYFDMLGEKIEPSDLYELVLTEMEIPKKCYYTEKN